MWKSRVFLRDFQEREERWKRRLFHGFPRTSFPQRTGFEHRSGQGCREDTVSLLWEICCDLKSYGDECLVKGTDRSSHRTYPTRQSGEVTNCSGTLGQWTPLARVASEPRGNGASASSEAEVGLGCMDSMVSICKLL